MLEGFISNRTVNAYGGGYHAWDVSKDQFISFQKVHPPTSKTNNSE